MHLDYVRITNKRRLLILVLFNRFTPKDRKKEAPPESSQASCFRFLQCSFENALKIETNFKISSQGFSFVRLDTRPDNMSYFLNHLVGRDVTFMFWYIMEDHLPSVVKFDVLTNKEKSLGKTVPSEIKNKVKEVGVISLSTPKVSMLVNQKGISYRHLVLFWIFLIPRWQRGLINVKKR